MDELNIAQCQKENTPIPVLFEHGTYYVLPSVKRIVESMLKMEHDSNAIKYPKTSGI